MLRELIGVRKVKKYYKQIISILLLIYLLIPFRVSDDEIIYVNNGSIYSGKIETNNLKMLISRIPFIFEIVHIRANLVDEKEIYKLKSGDIVYSLTYDKNNDSLYAIVGNKNNETYNIKEIHNSSEKIVKNFNRLITFDDITQKNNNTYYFGLYCYNDRLYYWSDDRKNSVKYLEIFNLKSKSIEQKIKVTNIGENIKGFNKNIIFSMYDTKKRNIYSVVNSNRIKILLKDMDMPIKVTDDKMICLDSINLKNIYLYDLGNGAKKIIGKNDGRAWYRYAFVLSNLKYYITEKNLTGYDIQEWPTVNDLNGSVQILHVEGPIVVY